MHYQNIDCAIQLIKRLGKGSLLSKSDILHAYKVVPVSKTATKCLFLRQDVGDGFSC